jgi:hypothetical protein
LGVIPVIHYNPDELVDVSGEIQVLKTRFETLAFRVSVEDDVEAYLLEIKKNLDLRRLILILDAGFCRLKSLVDDGDRSQIFTSLLEKIPLNSLKAVVCSGSCFPVSVVKYAGGGDDYGEFPISEVITTEALQVNFPIHHGDYGSIHPVRYEGGGGAWVPRIDFSTARTFFYYRCRRNRGGYVSAAKNVVRDPHYITIKDFDVWADSEIEAAAADHPNGRSPAHWIAVRVNRYITQQFLRLNRLKSIPKMSL